MDEVIQVASELAQISDEALLSRYEPENMHDLHPIGEWTDCPEIRRELLDDFHALQAFYAVQANAGNAVINYLVWFSGIVKISFCRVAPAGKDAFSPYGCLTTLTTVF